MFIKGILCIATCLAGIEPALAQTGLYAFKEGVLTASDPQPLGHLGKVSAISGNYAIAGAEGDAYIFVRNGTHWTQHAKLPSDGAQNFGRAVAISGSTAVVGSGGAAYVFVRNGPSWTQQASLTPTGQGSGTSYGTAVALSGNTAIVCAPAGDLPGKPDCGWAAVFVRTGTTWTQQAQLSDIDAVTFANFGLQVGLDGDYATILSKSDGFAFARTGTTWALQSHLHSGKSISNTTDTAVIGTGLSAFVFTRAGSTWTQQAELAAPARSVSILGNTIACGGQSVAYLFTRQGSVWTQQLKLASTGNFGYSVALTADRLAVGDPVNSGAEHVFHVLSGESPQVLQVTPGVAIFNTQQFVTIDTYGFIQGAATGVKFGATPASNVAWTGPTTLVCQAPPGIQGQKVDLSVNQGPLTATVVGDFTYVGTTIDSLTPASGPAAGGSQVAISGTYIPDDGSVVVKFGNAMASVVSVTAPDALLVTAPQGVPGSTVDVTITSSIGSDVLTDSFTYESLVLSSVTPTAGNLLGGNLVTLTVDLPTTVNDTSVTIGGQPAVVTSVGAGLVRVIVPPVSEPSGAAVDVSITNSNGTGVLRNSYTYTPALHASVTGNINSGLLHLDWDTKTASGLGQAAWVWLGDPSVTLPPGGVPLSNYAGKLHHVPLLFALTGLPVNFAPVSLGFGSLPASVVGVPLPIQSMITAEGGTKGSLSNEVTVFIPGP